MKNITITDLLFFKFILLTLICLMTLGCYSTYRVRHTETTPDGYTYTTEIREVIAPGGKKISDGIANIGTNGEDWHVKLGAQVQSDSTATAEMFQAMSDTIMKLGLTAGASYLGGQLISGFMPAKPKEGEEK